eukprot:GFKZ01010520.1.p1 GENE.GFKZ01010520.1~~GFKZ01010520.1.p1  ORF type:complete len:317 (-),score=25.91 GFKZ01010520.1:426-1292(-)
MPFLPLYIINAFTPPTSGSDASTPFNCGNPAAVVLLPPPPHAFLPDAAKQGLARELNLSETSFVTPTSKGTTFQLRWFTPEAEVNICGHATLAAAAALLKHGLVKAGDDVVFETAGGQLIAGIQGGDDATPRIDMEFPELATKDAVPCSVKRQVISALGLKEDRVSQILSSQEDGVVVVKEELDVTTLRADFKCLSQIQGWRGWIIAAPCKERGFVSRFFAPRLGVNEDPVTGSAHCALATVFLSQGEGCAAEQLSQRGGVVNVTRLAGAKVRLSGSWKLVVKGEIHI